MVYVETSRTKKKTNLLLTTLPFLKNLNYCIPIFESIFKYNVHKYVPRGIEINFDIVL